MTSKFENEMKWTNSWAHDLPKTHTRGKKNITSTTFWFLKMSLKLKTSHKHSGTDGFKNKFSQTFVKGTNWR